MVTLFRFKLHRFSIFQSIEWTVFISMNIWNWTVRLSVSSIWRFDYLVRVFSGWVVCQGDTWRLDCIGGTWQFGCLSGVLNCRLSVRDTWRLNFLSWILDCWTLSGVLDSWSVYQRSLTVRLSVRGYLTVILSVRGYLTVRLSVRRYLTVRLSVRVSYQLDFLSEDFDGWIVFYVYLTFGLSWHLQIGLSVMGTLLLDSLPGAYQGWTLCREHLKCILFVRWTWGLECLSRVLDGWTRCHGYLSNLYYCRLLLFWISWGVIDHLRICVFF